jgi:hypothetical protein
MNEELKDKIELEKATLGLNIVRVCTYTLTFVIISMCVSLVVGLFAPNDLVSNDEVFKILSPAFQTIIGGFIGIITGIQIGKSQKDDAPPPNGPEEE